MTKVEIINGKITKTRWEAKNYYIAIDDRELYIYDNKDNFISEIRLDRVELGKLDQFLVLWGFELLIKQVENIENLEQLIKFLYDHNLFLDGLCFVDESKEREWTKEELEVEFNIKIKF
jgi:hypothetical protein